MNNHELAELNSEYCVDMRRFFHTNAELSMEEAITSSKIEEELANMGIEYERVGKNNIIGHICFGPGKKLALRADIDALPIKEELDIAWKSVNDGVMHACGHDSHAAVLLATAKSLMGKKDDLSGEIYLCFQEGEECGMGADECVEYLLNKGGVDSSFALHVQAGMSSKTVDIKEGARLSGAKVFYIDITGKGGHGSRPDLSVDPIEVACDIYMHLKNIGVYNHNPFDTIVVSPAMLASGNRFNVIPDTAHIEGTVRYFKDGDGDMVMDEIRRICKSIGDFYGAEVTVGEGVAAKYPVVNDAESTKLALKAACDAGFEIADEYPSAGSDNFAEFIKAFGGCYCNMGVRSDRPGSCEKHHTSTFDIDESVLPMNVEFMLNYVDAFMQQ